MSAVKRWIRGQSAASKQHQQNLQQQHEQHQLQQQHLQQQLRNQRGRSQSLDVQALESTGVRSLLANVIFFFKSLKIIFDSQHLFSYFFLNNF